MSASKELSLTSIKLPDESLAFTNHVSVSKADFETLRKMTAGAQAPVSNSNDHGCDLVRINKRPFVFTFEAHRKVKDGELAVSGPIRKLAAVALAKPIIVEAWKPPTDLRVVMVKADFEVDFLMKKTGKKAIIAAEAITEHVIQKFFYGQFLAVGQNFVGDVLGEKIEIKLAKCECVSPADLADPENMRKEATVGGILGSQTICKFTLAPGSELELTGASSSGGGAGILDAEWNFESMGIGGLQHQFNQIFRRAFASRVFPSEMIAKLGIKHVKGILLYGPPGTGKTLMARQIGQMLNGKEPKVVNGPEILNKYVGQSEENIRDLFKEAEEEYKARGENSSLHIIIFDEIDAICRQRGSRSDSTGVHDGVVNQLLSKIDGVNSLNNILVIGMTNRKDLLDDALLRAGRLEVHVEINLPDAEGRLQILNIHTNKMREHKMLGKDVDLPDIAKRTKNFSGAELETLVKGATSFSLYKNIDTVDGLHVKEGEIVVDQEAFEYALREVKPSFGVATEEFESAMRNGIVTFSPAVDALLQTADVFIKQVATSERTSLISVLLEGPPGAGKTALAAKMAKASGYPYVKLLSPENMVTLGELGKADKITKTFLDAYKSPLSLIVIDDLERLLDYVRVGPRFSNTILQTLLVLLRREPPVGHKLLIVATTANANVLRDLEFAECFHARLQVPFVTSEEECMTVLRELGIFEAQGSKGGEAEEMLAAAGRAFGAALRSLKLTRGVPVKRLIMASEMCMQGEEAFSVRRFENAIHSIAQTFSTGSASGLGDDFSELV